MTAPTAQALAATAKHIFNARNISLPSQWKAMGPLFDDAFSPSERKTQSNPPDRLFHEPTVNHYHTRAAGIMGREYSKFIDGISAAITQAISQWMAIASIVSALPAGLAAMVMPGGVTGPVLKPMILSRAPRQDRQEWKYSTAIATAVSDGWANWQQGLTGVLTYAALYAPPVPNIPATLISFSSAGEATLSPGPLADAMHRALNDSGAMHATVLFDSLAKSFYTQFLTFKAGTLVMGVLMAPPIPGIVPTPGNFI